MKIYSFQKEFFIRFALSFTKNTCFRRNILQLVLNVNRHSLFYSNEWYCFKHSYFEGIENIKSRKDSRPCEALRLN